MYYAESYSDLPVIQYYNNKPPCVINSTLVTELGDMKEISTHTKSLVKRDKSFFKN